eukprot:4718041-Amphidinium_carterae.1
MRLLNSDHVRSGKQTFEHQQALPHERNISGKKGAGVPTTNSRWGQAKPCSIDTADVMTASATPNSQVALTATTHTQRAQQPPSQRKPSHWASASRIV